MTNVTVIAGGVGAAKFARGLQRILPGENTKIVVNTGDDVRLHGLHISPDIDTVTYTLADAINPETGWGRRDETWNAMGTLADLGGETWFNLGDRDLGTHLFRTGALERGERLSAVTATIARAMGLTQQIMPMTDDRIETRVMLADGPEVGFQEYFVGQRHSVAVSAVRFDGADRSVPAPGVLAAIEDADRIIVAPSNPLVSIGPVLAVPGVRDALRSRRRDVVAISPIVGGAALKGPADRMLTELGHESSVAGVGDLYADIAAALVIDTVDGPLQDEVAASGVAPLVTGTVMSTVEIAAELATFCLDARLPA